MMHGQKKQVMGEYT